MSTNTPTITPDLIEYLEKSFPNRLPTTDEILNQTALTYVGEQRVIDRLRGIMKRQQAEAEARNRGVPLRTSFEE